MFFYGDRFLRKRNKMAGRVGSLAIAAVFFLNVVILDPAAAVTNVPVPFIAHPAGPVEFNPSDFVLPSHLGYADDISKGPSNKTVIHIQDAHCNYAAQMAIYNLIAYLRKTYDVRLLNLEGGIGDYDLSVFADIEDEKKRIEIADYFLKEGRISGAEFFAIDNPGQVTLKGIDSRTWYFRNLDSYRSFHPSKEMVDANIHALREAFHSLKKKIYSRDLLEFDRHCASFNNGDGDFKDYVTYMAGLAETENIAVKEFPNIDAILKVLSLEEGIDFKTAERERGDLVDELRKRLSMAEREALVVKVVAFRMKTISQKAFYSYLMEKSENARMNLGKYPNLLRYVGYLYVYGAVDNQALFEEIDRMRERLEDAMFENDEQRELALNARRFDVFDKLLNIKATRRDYDRFKDGMETGGVEDVVRYVRSKCKEIGIDSRLDDDVSRLGKSLADIAAFYVYASRRDAGLVGNREPDVVFRDRLVNRHNLFIAPIIRADIRRFGRCLRLITQFNNICQNSTGRGQRPGTFAIEHHIAHRAAV